MTIAPADFATPLCIAGEREGSGKMRREGGKKMEGCVCVCGGGRNGKEEEEGRKKMERDRESERKRSGRVEEDKMQSAGEVAGKLSVNGSLEKRSSRTIYILSMRQNYIIAHTRNHTAHTQD